MALSAVISKAELARVAALAYESRPVRVSLAYLQSEGFTSDSPVTDWDSIKIVGNGYTDFLANILPGAYDNADNRHEMPVIQAEFTADGAGYQYNCIYIVMGTYGAAVNATNAEITANVATITTDAAHGFIAGDKVLLSGMTDTDYSGFHTVVDAPTTTTFTYSTTLSDKAAAAETGTAKKATEEADLHSVLTENPSIVLGAAQTQVYRIRLCTDD